MLKNIFAVMFFCTFQLVNVVGQAQNNDSLLIASYLDKALSVKDSASFYLDKAKSFASKPSLKNQFEYGKARHFFMLRDLDVATTCSQNALENAQASGSQYWLMRNYVLSASIKSLKKDYQSAISQFVEAQRIALILKDTMTSASILSNVGNTYLGVKDYSSANRYLNEAITLFRTQKDTIYTPTLLAVNALSLLSLKQYEEAEAMSIEAMDYAKKYNNYQAILIVNHCLGELKRTRGKYDEALEYFNTSLSMAEKANLAHYILLNNNGIHHTYTEIGDCKEAIRIGEKTLEIATAQSNLDIMTVIKRNLSTCYAKTNQFAKAYQIFKESFALYDSTSNLENKREIANLLNQINTEQKDKELLSANVKILEQDNKIQKRNFYIFGLLGIASLLGLGIYFNSKVNAEKIKKISLEKEQEALRSEIRGGDIERKRISQDLHDGVAGSIVGIKAKLNHLGISSNVPVDEITNMLGEVHQEIRHISHDLLPPPLEKYTLSQVIENYLIQFNRPDLNTHFSGNMIEDNLSMHSKKLIYRLCQEAIQNAIKHANASHIFVNMFSNNDGHSIMIEDNGVGFDTGNTTINQGLSTMQERIKNLNGSLEIDSALGRGTIISLNLKNE